MNIKTGVHLPKIPHLVRNIGREFKKIRDNRVIVEAFKSDIDLTCGKGGGSELVRSVTGHSHIFVWKLTKLQRIQLDLRAAHVLEAGRPPKGMKEEFSSENEVKWLASYQLGSKSLKVLKDQITDLFN